MAVWEAITGEILLQDGTGAFLFTAGGTIKQGQAVGISDDNAVKSGSTAQQYDIIGLALYDAVSGAELAVAGPGNICYCANDAADAVGTIVYGGDDGLMTNTAGSATKVGGVVVEAGVAITSNYKQKVLLV